MLHNHTVKQCFFEKKKKNKQGLCIVLYISECMTNKLRNGIEEEEENWLMDTFQRIASTGY